MHDIMCDYDEAYTRADAREIGFCGKCGVTSCKNNRNYEKSYNSNYGNPMYMTPDDYRKIIDKKDKEIQRLQKIVADVTENIKIVGRQNTRLKRKCDRYEKILTDMHFNGEYK